LENTEKICKFVVKCVIFIAYLEIANPRIIDMNRRIWLIPLLIIVANALAIGVRWGSLSEILPAHYDLQGDAGGTMPRSMLLLYILIGAIVCLVAYALGRLKQKLQNGLVVLSSGICLVLLLSTIVTLTSGTMPIFMLAEPVVLLAAVIGSAICVVKSYKKKLK
jgi:hypothetical protein